MKQKTNQSLPQKFHILSLRLVVSVLVLVLLGITPSHVMATEVYVTYSVVTSNIQQRKLSIKGVVTDTMQEPLAGASILVKGTQVGTLTDVNGNFQLDVAQGSILVISFIGMNSQELHVTKSEQYTIRLEQNTELLKEVVVTGYQTLSKERSTGAFAKVSAADLETKRMSNLSNILEGRIAGYVAGKIRGVTTMNAVANPMVVIDGFPIENTSMDRSGRTTDNMPDLNPEDIESITVLKDAAAASIYGARAANGVIVITTKKAKLGKTEVSLSSTFTVQPYHFYTANRTDAKDIVELERTWAEQNEQLHDFNQSKSVASDLRDNGSMPSLGINTLLDMYTHKISMEEGNQILNTLSGMGYLYYDQVKKYAKRTRLSQQHNLRVSKTTDKNSFVLSTTYWNNRSKDVHKDNQKLGINLNNTLDLTSWLKTEVGIYLRYGVANSPNFDVMNPGYNILPYDALVGSDGSLISAPLQGTKDRRDLIQQYKLHPEVIIPVNELNYQLEKSKEMETRTYGKLKFLFTDWLNYHIMFQYETDREHGERLRERESYDVVTLINNFASNNNGEITYNIPEGDILYIRDMDRRSYNFRQQLNLNKHFYDRHDVSWIIGQEVRHSKIEYNDRSLYGYDSELLSWPSINENSLAYMPGILGAAQLRHDNITTKKELVNRFVSFYSNFSYTYDNKYVITGSIRWDRSNLWGTSSKYQNKPLWSVGASWNVDQEPFAQLKWINMLKLRTSYGIGGNIGRNTAPYLIAQYYAAQYGTGLTGIVLSPPNKNIRWEKTTTFNVGLDFAILGNHLGGSLDFYHKNSDDLLSNINGSPTHGFGYSLLTTNNGRMINTGMELSLNAEILRTSDFSWNATVLYAYNKNLVKSVAVKPANYDSRLEMPVSYPVVGNPLNGLYAYRWAGLDKSGDPQVYDAQGNVTSKNVRDANAIVYKGSTIPVHSGSVTNVLRYKDFEFSMMFLFDAGHKIRDTFPPAINMGNGRVVTTNKDIMNRWKKSGDEIHTNVPRLLFSNDKNNFNRYRSTLYRYSDLFVYNASNIRLNNLSFAYYIPDFLCKKVFISRAKVQFNVENVAIFAFDSRAHYSLNGKQKPNFVMGLSLNF